MKWEILRTLREREDYVSGQQLCQGLGVSRTAVWKAIEELRTEGYVIDAVRNRGYCLVKAADAITPAELKTELHTKWLGREIQYFDVTDSTNTQAKRLAEAGAPHGTLAVADRQTAGKGRRGRQWESPSGTGAWFSMVLRPEMNPANACMLTLIAGMAVAAGIKEAVGLEAGIKWPNDLVIGGKKICGILTEMSTEAQDIRYVVTGIGINVNTVDFPKDIQNTATSLLRESGKAVRRSRIIGAVAKAFEYYYERFMETCDMSALRREYDEMLVNRDRQVTVLDPRGSYEGTALGIDEGGNLLVCRTDGSVISVISGEVSVRGIYGYV